MEKVREQLFHNDLRDRIDKPGRVIHRRLGENSDVAPDILIPSQIM